MYMEKFPASNTTEDTESRYTAALFAGEEHLVALGIKPERIAEEPEEDSESGDTIDPEEFVEYDLNQVLTHLHRLAHEGDETAQKLHAELTEASREKL